jgi:hypothetical protein
MRWTETVILSTSFTYFIERGDNGFEAHTGDCSVKQERRKRKAPASPAIKEDYQNVFRQGNGGSKGMISRQELTHVLEGNGSRMLRLFGEQTVLYALHQL